MNTTMKHAEEFRVSTNLIRAEIHKAILGIRSATPEQVARSKKWLVEHGFQPYM